MTVARYPGTGSGTVTSVSVVSSGGFTGTVATANTTPSITLSYTGKGVPYDIPVYFTGVPGVSAVILRYVAVRAFTLSASGQKGSADTAATAQTDFLVAVNGTTKATLRFAISGTTSTVVGGTAATIAAGDVITITAPGTPDISLANIAFNLTGVLL